HEMTTWHVHEEIQLLAIDFSTMLFETMAPMPSYRDWYKSHDQTPSYRYLKTVLKVLQWARGGDRWVLKSPQHLEQFGTLMATFPDATVVVTHRDPVAVTASMATMISYTARLHLASVNPVAIGQYWAARGEDLFRACVEDRGVLPADQSLDIRFHEFMADEAATVAEVYRLAGQPMTETARSAMAEFVATHPRGRHGGVRYQPAAVGLDVAERRAALKFYVERFGVEEELTSPSGGR
ncbi:MAG TPA: sulfotransferase, partial [Acidimicrobiales bacterium]|nr:sulfotransferase [Acidimicrobiales bacterium]